MHKNNKGGMYSSKVDMEVRRKTSGVKEKANLKSRRRKITEKE